LQQNLGRGDFLDLGLKVPGYHGELGKKEKSAPGVRHVVTTANVKKPDSGTYIKGIWESTQNGYFFFTLLTPKMKKMK
jgi:hypothetical protein